MVNAGTTRSQDMNVKSFLNSQPNHFVNKFYHAEKFMLCKLIKTNLGQSTAWYVGEIVMLIVIANVKGNPVERAVV